MSDYPNKKRTAPTYHSIVLAGRVVQTGFVAENKRDIRWNAPQYLQWFLKEKAKIGDVISAKFVCRRPKRTEEQNSFFHVYLSLISISSGHSMKELKSWYKGKFLTKGISEVFGEKTRVVESSADLNISEFCELMNKIEEATNIPIPDPTPFSLPLSLDEFGKLKYVQRETYRKMKPREFI